MQFLLYNIGQVLGIAILHSLWQGLLIWILLRAAISSLPDLSAIKKYNLAATAMLAIAAWFLVTLFNEAANLNWHPAVKTPGAGVISMAGLKSHSSPFTAQADRYYYVIEAYLPYISILYTAGLVVNLLKLSYCRLKLHQIRKTLFPAGDLQWLVDDFSVQLNIRRYVRVNFTSLVDVPCMIGHLKPIILLPFSLAANLSVAETEAILLHELAHIKRNDYLINLLQQVINSLLFFNPFAQVISGLINTERENCCDDLVVQTTNKPLVYARALLKLEESRRSNLQLALAASTQKHYLLTRIERIMKTQQKTGNIRHLVLAILLLAGSLGSIAWLNPEIKNGKITVKAIKPAEAMKSLFTPADTTLKKADKSDNKKFKTTAFKTQKLKKQVYNNSGDVYQTFSINDPQLDKLTAEVNKHAAEISKYYESDKFKNFSADIDKQGKEIDAFYNSDKIKKITAEQEKLGADFEKISKNPNVEGYGKQMEALGKKIERYFNSTEFKNMNAKLKAKYGIKSDYNDDRNENYRKYQDELQSNLSPEIKSQTKAMSDLGEKMRSFYQSDEFVGKSEKLRAMGDSIRQAYDNPQIKQQQEELRRLGGQMRAYADNPEIKKQKELLKQATERLHTYTNSPQFKAKMKQYSSSHKVFRSDNDNYNNNNNNNNNNNTEVKIDAPPAPVKP